MLRDINNKELIIEVLLFLSSLCRKSGEVYPTINQLKIFPDLKKLLECNDSAFKSRVCNLLGNMCRHNEFFYEQIKSSGIIPTLLKCCYDNDKATRKFACFAIGNAAFLNNSLYESFRPIIPRMVELLKDSEDNTRANSAGALGNFVRCGDQLTDDLIKYKAHEALLQLAETQDSQQIQVIRVALFALGNFCNNPKIKIELEKINFRSRIEALRSKYANDKQLLEHIERIRKKINN
jgi:fused-like protein